MKKPPCVPNCPHRNIDPNCHMTCKIYLDWRSDKDKENTARHLQELELEYVIDAQKRMRRARYHGCKQE